MEEDKSEIQPEKDQNDSTPAPAMPEKEAGNVPPTPSKPATDTKPAMEVTKGPGKAGVIFRSLLIGLGVIVVAFLAGVLTYHLVRYKPTETSLSQANQSIADLQTSSDALTSQLDIANRQISNLKSENQALQTSLETAELHIELLQALAEINAAHIALTKQDVAAAKVALSNTGIRLESLKPSIGSVDAALADNISQRLALINTSMDNDLESARAELGLLANNLINVETLLFGE